MQSIRQATASDFESIVPLSIELHEFSAAAVPSRLRVAERYDETRMHDYFTKVLDNDRAAYLVCAEGSELIGFAEVRVEDAEDDPGVVPVRRGYLQTLLVTERYRGQGVGSRLLAAAEDWARVHDAEEMVLNHWLFPGDPGPFYERAGYRPISEMRVHRPVRYLTPTAGVPSRDLPGRL